MRHILLALHLLFTAINIHNKPRLRLLNSNDLNLVCRILSVNSAWLYLVRLCSTTDEEYWAKQSQKYAAELAGANAQTSQAGIKPQASAFTGAGIPQYAPQVQHQVASPAAPAVATIVSSTGRPSLSSAERPSTNRQSSGRLAQSTITKPDFIRQFQLACNVSCDVGEFCTFP